MPSQPPSFPALRTTHSSWVRSAYAVEYNPWTTREDVETVLLLRGAIVSAFGQIETLLGEIAVRASRLPQYAALRDTFPHSVDRRISFLRRAFELDPLAVHRSIANNFLSRFEAAADLRHMMAHARMQVLGKVVTFHDFPQSNKNGIATRRQPFTILELERQAWRAAKLGRVGHRLLSRLDSAALLPPNMAPNA